MISVTEEIRAMTTGAAIVDRSNRTRIAHHGKDALDLLHRLSTNDLLNLGDGEVRGTVVTNGDGRIIDVLAVVRRQESPALVLGSPGRGSALIEWIDQYTFGEDSRLEDSSGTTAQITLVGPESARLLARIAGDEALPQGQNRWTRAEMEGQPAEIVAQDYLGLRTYEVIVPVPVAAGVRQALVNAGATIAGNAAFGSLRVHLGVPEFGADFDEQNNPHEGNLVSLVSFTKGCYIGQEVVARLDTYDKVRRRIVKVEAEGPFEYGTALLDGDRAVGAVKTVSAIAMGDRTEALALVRRGFWDRGTRLATSSGVHVNVISSLIPAPAPGR